MSSDKLIKSRIKQMLLREKIADYGQGQGNVGAGFMDWVPYERYGAGQDPYFTRSARITDIIRGVAGQWAPIGIMAVKTISDLGTGAMTFGRTLFSGVGSIFSGRSPNVANIIADQRRAFQMSDYRARDRMQRWGPRTNPLTNTRDMVTVNEDILDPSKLFELQQYARSEAAESERMDSEIEILSAVDSDLERFMASVQETLAATSADSLVSLGSSAIGISTQDFSTSALEVEEDITADQRLEVERRMLPHLKGAFLGSAIDAVEQARQYAFEAYRSSDVSVDPVAEDQMRSKYQNVITRLETLKSGLA